MSVRGRVGTRVASGVGPFDNSAVFIGVGFLRPVPGLIFDRPEVLLEARILFEPGKVPPSPTSDTRGVERAAAQRLRFVAARGLVFKVALERHLLLSGLTTFCLSTGTVERR